MVMSPVEDDPEARFRQRYAEKNAPWDSGVPSSEMVRVLDAGLLPGTTALELGCGTGTNAIELARRGYHVTAIDLVDLPIEAARKKARHAQVKVDFRVGDMTKVDLGGPYDVLFDIGLYHGQRNRDLAGLLRVLTRVSRRGTRWLSLAGNAREPLPDGPPVVREEEFRAELGGLFRFLEITEFRFELRPDFRPLAWSILMERR
jgi:SAM-dependent methyltransferase